MNPSDSSKMNFKASSECVKHIAESIKGEATFQTMTHQQTLQDAKKELKKTKKATYDEKFNAILHISKNRTWGLLFLVISGQFFFIQNSLVSSFLR